MDKGESLLPRSESSCLTITVVGVLGDDVPDHARLVAVGDAILQAVKAEFPTFEPGYPPIAVACVTLPELRTPDA